MSSLMETASATTTPSMTTDPGRFATSLTERRYTEREEWEVAILPLPVPDDFSHFTDVPRSHIVKFFRVYSPKGKWGEGGLKCKVRISKCVEYLRMARHVHLLQFTIQQVSTKPENEISFFNGHLPDFIFDCFTAKSQSCCYLPFNITVQFRIAITVMFYIALSFL